MCTVILKNILTDSPDLPFAGDIFYKRIMESDTQSQKVIVNMEGVASLPSVFLNVSIGRIIDTHGIQWIKDHLTFTHITKSQAMRLSDYLSRYKPMV